jgi:DNA adenine methylase
MSTGKQTRRRLTPPLKWHGGKHYLAPKIVELMPKHLHYVEPYFGGGAVLLARDPADQTKFWGRKSYELGVSEVVNDVNGDLMNFWQVLQDERAFTGFMRQVEAIPFSQVAWEQAQPKVTPDKDGNPDLEAAVAFFVWCRQSRSGQMGGFAPLSRSRTRRGMNEQASAWLTCVEGLPEIHERLKRVAVVCEDAIKVIRQQDGPRTLFYCDPPYLHETRTSTDAYHHEMSEGDHVELLETLATIQGSIMLSGYPNELYDRFAKEHGWHHADFDLPNNAAGGKSKRRMTERVWMNFQPE